MIELVISVLGVLAIAATWDIFRRRYAFQAAFDATHKRIDEVQSTAESARATAQNILDKLNAALAGQATKLSSVPPRFGR